MSGHGPTDKLLSPIRRIRIIVRMPKPDCFLRYRMRCNAEFYYVGKILPIGLGRRGCSDAWFYNGFIHRKPSEQLRRRYARSTEYQLLVKSALNLAISTDLRQET